MTVRAVVVAAGAHIFTAAHVPAIAATGVDVVGVFDADAARAASVGAANGWPVAGSVEELLSIDADVAIVCAPHPLHAGLVERCLEAGLDVLVEKPVAGRLSEIDDIVAAAARAGRRVAVVHQHRLREEVIEAHRLIAAGELGRIHRAVVTASYPKRSVYYTDTAWRGTWHGEGGGVLLNQGVHDLDLLVHLLGRPARVAAVLRTAVHPIEAEDTADLLVQWHDGATATVHITSAAAGVPARLEVFGSAGALRLSAAGLERRTAAEDFDRFAAQPGGHFDALPVSDRRLTVAHGGGTHADVYADAFAAWRRGADPAVPAIAARDAVELIAAAVLADERRAWIELPVDPAAYDAVLDARIDASQRGARTGVPA